MADYSKYLLNGNYEAYCEGPIATLDVAIPAVAKWSKNYIYNPQTGQDDITSRTVRSYIDYYYISTNGTKAIIHLRAREPDPCLLGAEMTEAELAIWENDIFPLLGFIANNMMNRAELEVLISNGTYLPEAHVA